MAGAASDAKYQPPPPEMTGSTAVASAPERFNSVRIVDVSRNGSKNSTTSSTGAAVRSKPESFLGERLSKLGITRRPTGEALTTDYVQRAGSVRKPVVTLADPPAPAKKKKAEDGEDGSTSKTTATTPTWSVFPKIDPEPKGTLQLKTVREESPTQRPPSSGGTTLQAWLRTAATSPFATATSSKGAPGPKRISKRMSEIKWPLQGNSASNGLGRSATDASSRYSQATVAEGGDIPVVMVRDNPAAAGSPRVVAGGRGPGLPGSVKKVPAGSVENASALGRK